MLQTHSKAIKERTLNKYSCPLSLKFTIKHAYLVVYLSFKGFESVFKRIELNFCVRIIIEMSTIILSVLLGGVAVSAIAVSHVLPHTVPPGLNVALRHVPVWTHAHQVLLSHLSRYAKSGAIGSGIGVTLGALLKLIKR
ncbi:hypothetical protein B9P99_03395 [Candidatus Marsarchaeota G1 archaeon OSP_B]|jgi:hypothetical protein|uniref:Uncharacterized protein n=1 Tax=Candidatus Marsarchaeota G1 archaeon OSP_B TaxID=1978153 RepID=A0A2R6B1X4_9ARCH|nr:MAG: hypothetical protein B9P99_03395 [Candidatus Marsarchaeota G1 archaeon OSP_B]